MSKFIESQRAAPLPPAEPRFGAVVALIYLAALLPRIWVHVLWRDEWQAWMIAVPTPPPGEFFARLAYEGHPGLWHVLLWLAGRLWPDPLAMKLLSALVASGVAFVVAGFAPFTRPVRVLICSGYFLVFEYAVVSRNYGLGVLALACFAALALRRPRAFVWQGVALAVATEANLFATLLAVAAGVVVLAGWVADGRPAPRRFVVGAAVLAAGLGLCAWQMWPPADRQYATLTTGLDVAVGGRVLAGIWRALAPLPWPGRFWWGNNLLDFTLLGRGPLMAVQPLLGLGAAALVTWMMPRRRDALGLWLAGGAVLLAMLYVVFPGGLRHQGHWMVLALLALWLGGGFAALSPAKRRLWVALLCVQAAAGLLASAADVLLPFSASRAAGAFILARYPPDAAVVAEVDFACSPVAGVLGRPLYYPSGDRWGRFIRWDGLRHPNHDLSALAPLARRLRDESRVAGGSGVVLLLVSSRDQHPRHDQAEREPGPRFRLAGSFGDSTVADERYRVYEFLAPDGSDDTSRTSPPAPRADE